MRDVVHNFSKTESTSDRVLGGVTESNGSGVYATPYPKAENPSMEGVDIFEIHLVVVALYNAHTEPFSFCNRTAACFVTMANHHVIYNKGAFANAPLPQRKIKAVLNRANKLLREVRTKRRLHRANIVVPWNNREFGKPFVHTLHAPFP